MSWTFTGAVLDGIGDAEVGGDLSTGTTGMSCGMGLLAAPINVLGGMLWSLGISCVRTRTMYISATLTGSNHNLDLIEIALMEVYVLTAKILTF